MATPSNVIHNHGGKVWHDGDPNDPEIEYHKSDIYRHKNRYDETHETKYLTADGYRYEASVYHENDHGCAACWHRSAGCATFVAAIVLSVLAAAVAVAAIIIATDNQSVLNNTVTTETSAVSSFAESQGNARAFRCSLIPSRTLHPQIGVPTQPFTQTVGAIEFVQGANTVVLSMTTFDASLKTVSLHGPISSSLTSLSAPQALLLYTRPGAPTSPLTFATTTPLAAPADYSSVASQPELFYIQVGTDGAPGGDSRAYLSSCVFRA